MTTIAWDGKTLVADRRVSYGTLSDASMTKIAKTKRGLCGASGTSATCAAFRRWFMAGEKGNPTMFKEAEDANGFIIRKNGARFMYDKYGWYEVDPGPFAIGTGWEVAMGAMSNGATAQEAVQIAAKLDGATGNTVDILEL